MPAVVRVPVESSLATGSVNVWHWIIPNSSPVTEVSGICTALDTFYTACATVFSVQTFTIGNRCVTVDQSPNLIISATTQTATGSGAGQAQLSTCFVAQLGSNVVGGSHRGRVYLGPLNSSAVQSDGRTPTVAQSNTVVSALATLMGFTTNGVQLAVWSRKLLAAQPVTSVGVRPLIGVQRRRLS
jgi:hypothetical protein